MDQVQPLTAPQFTDENRVLVYANLAPNKISEALEHVHTSIRPITLLISGHTNPVDKEAEGWASWRKVPTILVPNEWGGADDGVNQINRKRKMLIDGRPNMIITSKDSIKTPLISMAEALGITIWIIE